MWRTIGLWSLRGKSWSCSEVTNNFCWVLLVGQHICKLLSRRSDTEVVHWLSKSKRNIKDSKEDFIDHSPLGLVRGATVVPEGQSMYVFVGRCGRSVWYGITIHTYWKISHNGVMIGDGELDGELSLTVSTFRTSIYIF